MGLHLSSNHAKQLLKWAREAGNRECCGLLLGEGMEIAAIQNVLNVAIDPLRHFEIDPASLIAAQKQSREGGPHVIGYFHSHPNGRAEPSSTDVAHATADGKYWLIIANGELSAWLPVAKDNVVVDFERVTLTVQG